MAGQMARHVAGRMVGRMAGQRAIQVATLGLEESKLRLTQPSFSVTGAELGKNNILFTNDICQFYFIFTTQHSTIYVLYLNISLQD
jgi:hypothetical protein